MKKGLLQSKTFYIDHLEPFSDKTTIDTFQISIEEGMGLLHYLQYYAVDDEITGKMRTYFVRDIVTDECVKTPLR